MGIYSTSAGFADEWLFCRTERDPDLSPTRSGLNSVAVDFARSLDQPQMSSDPPLGCAGDDRFIVLATFSYKSFAILQGISILITVGPMSPCVSACSRIFSNWSALLTSPRIASENSFRIIASSRDPRRTCRPSRYSTSSDRTLQMVFAISVESRFPRPFGFGQTPFLNRV